MGGSLVDAPGSLSPADIPLHRSLVHVLSLANRPRPQLIDQGDQPVDRGVEQDASFLSRCCAWIAVHARLRPAAPEIIETHGIVAGAVAADELAHAVIVL